MVHNRYLARGGEDESVDAELRLLQRAGVHATLFEVDNKRIAQLGRLRTAARAVWSPEMYRRVRKAVRDGGYDVVHVQNFFPLASPAVHAAAGAEGAAVVQSLRNYRLSCVNGLLFRAGAPCEACLGRAVPWPGVVHACYRDSHAGSAAVAAMIAVHRAAGTWNRRVDLYIAASAFARTKAIDGGLPGDCIVVKPNFVASDPGCGTGQGGYALYVGRLAPGKGVETLLAAWRRLTVALPLWIVGDGPLRPLVERTAEVDPRIKWLGQLPLEEVNARMGEATFLVFPSEGYETFGRTVVEAFAKGTPVLCTDRGAGAELVDEGRTGCHFRAADVADLASTATRMVARPDDLARMRRHARAEYESKYTAALNLELLLDAYARALEQSAARRRCRRLALAGHR